MAAPTLQASFAHAGNPTTAPTGTLPATQANDILFILVTNGGADTDPTMSGTSITTGGLTWTKKTSANGGALTDLNGSLWWTRATGNHTGQTIIATTTNSGSLAGGVVRGAVTSGDPFDNATTQLNATGVNTITGFTPSVNECLIILGLLTDDNIASDTYAGTGSPSSYTEQQDALSNGGNDTAAAFATGTQTTAAATGVITWNNARGAGIYEVVILAAVKPVATVTATMAASFGGLTATATATRTVVATALGSFGAASATLTAGRTVNATVAATFGALTATFTATKTVAGVLAGNLGSLTASAVAVPTVGATAAGSFGSLSASAVAGRAVTATAGGSFGPLTATAAGVRTATATAVSTFGPLTASTAAIRTVTATAVTNVGGLAATAVGTVSGGGVSGFMLGNFGGLTATVVGAVTAGGTLLGHFGALTSTVIAGRTVLGVATSSFGSLTAVVIVPAVPASRPTELISAREPAGTAHGSEPVTATRGRIAATSISARTPSARAGDE